MEELCYVEKDPALPAMLDLAKGKMHHFASYRCGKDTWLDVCSLANCDAPDVENFISSAGLVANPGFNDIKGHIVVGEYDISVPAVNIFAGDNCSGLSSRLYSSTNPE